MVRAFYVDASAAVKLGTFEDETPALKEFLARTGNESGSLQLVSSELLVVEVFRALRRVMPDGALRARVVCDKIATKSITPDVIRFASVMEPSPLRGLDAIHLATAVSLGPSIQSVITFDDRMIEACTQLGLEAVSPGKG
jgi:predicted nucleic acid-binding protein